MLRFSLQFLAYGRNLNTRPTESENRCRQRKKDFVAAQKFWSPNYIQHSAHIPPGRDGLFGLVKSGPSGMKYENSLIMADGDMLMLHGRFSGLGLPANWIVVDIVRIENGLLAEHWDVIEDEVTREKSASGQPMFGEAFPS